MHRSLHYSAWLLCLAALACGEHPGHAPGASPPLSGAPVSMRAAPTLRVGVAEGDTTLEFHRVVTPFRLPDGRLVVPVAGSGVLRVFSADGTLLESLGRPGDGPGEFRSLAAAWPRGDTIEAFDAALERITCFPPSAEPRVVTLRAPGNARALTEAQAIVPGALSDGWMLYGVESAGMGRRDTVAVRRFGPDGSPAALVARLPGMARYSTPMAGGPDPLSPRTAFAIHAGRVYVAETMKAEIWELDGDGHMELELSWTPENPPSPKTAFREAVQAAVAAAPPEQRPVVRERLESFPVRDRVPVFWSFLVDADGFVWVEPFEPARHSMVLPAAAVAESASVWSLFTPGGTAAGTIRVPAGFQPASIGRDAVVGVRRDSLGVEYVEVHALERR